MKLACQVYHEKYNTLCIGLGFSLTECDNILENKFRNHTKAATEVLIQWSTKHGRGPEQRMKLRDVWEAAGLGSLEEALAPSMSRDHHQSTAEGWY